MSSLKDRAAKFIKGKQPRCAICDIEPAKIVFEEIALAMLEMKRRAGAESIARFISKESGKKVTRHCVEQHMRYHDMRFINDHPSGDTI